MPWRIRWTAQAVRDMEALDRPVAARVVKRVEAAAADPPRFFRRLAGAEDWKLRVGDWRVLALLSFETRTVLVERVEHRRSVYR